MAIRSRSTYLVESYSPDPERQAAHLLELASAPEGSTWPGTGVGYCGCIAVPGDEVALHLFEGIDPEAVLGACRNAGIRCDRIVPITAFEGATPLIHGPLGPTEA
ncbi:MAG: hypothetical protein U0869_23640 [Chloroflexota bacterium]